MRSKMEDETRARIEALSEPKPASELTEVLEVGEKVAGEAPLSLKERIALLRARGSVISKSAPKRETVPSQVEKSISDEIAVEREWKADETQPLPLHPGVEIVPGDMGKPQNEVEALVESDRQFATLVVDENIEAASDKMLNAEALFSESLAEKSLDRDRFKAVYMNTVKIRCNGLTLEQVEENIRRDHDVLFDTRTGIQAQLAYRAELLKDATAEERAKRLKDDWLFKPAKKVAEVKTKSSAGPKKAAYDPAAAIRNTMMSKAIAKGLTGDAAKEWVATKMAKLGL
jgi:hypothetical protein